MNKVCYIGLLNDLAQKEAKFKLQGFMNIRKQYKFRTVVSEVYLLMSWVEYVLAGTCFTPRLHFLSFNNNSFIKKNKQNKNPIVQIKNNWYKFLINRVNKNIYVHFYILECTLRTMHYYNINLLRGVQKYD